MQVGQASVFKFTKTGKYLIYSNSKLEMGASIATEPFIKLDASTPIEEVTKQILYALSCSKTNLPNPKDWATFNKEYLQAIGLKSNKDLHKNTISLGVSRMDNVIVFTPMINNGANGFINVPDGKIELSFDSSDADLTKALKEALDKCE
jgi:hypothetical protein